MLVQTLSLDDEAATIELGATLARCLSETKTTRGLILLSGELGVGKSTLVRALLRALGIEGPIPSPTYTLVEPYEVGERVIRHLDLYRIGEPSELEALGGRELFDALVMVEWPERAPQLRANAGLAITLQHAPPGRQVTLEWGEMGGFTSVANVFGNLLEQSSLSA